MIFVPRLVTKTRTFFMQAKSESEANEWVAILKWRLVSGCLSYRVYMYVHVCTCFPEQTIVIMIVYILFQSI